MRTWQKKTAILKKLLDECRDAGISTDYETLNYRVCERFCIYMAEDKQCMDYRRLLYTYEECSRLFEESAKAMESYLDGTKTAFSVPHYVTSDVEADGSALIAETETDGVRTRRPVYFVGYGHFTQAKNDIPVFNDFGANTVQQEIGPWDIMKNPIVWDIAYNNGAAEILNMGGSVKILQRLLRPEDKARISGYEEGEGFFQKTDENGCAPVVEVLINMHSEEHPDWKEMQLGINTLMYDITEKDLYIVYDTVNFRLVYDGIVINNNLPFGTLDRPAGTAAVNRGLVSGIAFTDEIGAAKYYRRYETLDKKLNYYTPYGHNTFIGDVVNFCHDGVYHLLYMPDRHHHQNRWWGGGHHFEHMITRDFIDWEDVGPI